MTSGNVDVPQTEPAPEESDADEGGDDRASPARPERLSLDVIFEILKNGRRRAVLEFLADTDESVSLGELAEHVAARENDKSVSALTSGERKRVYVGLYQCHLPKMDDAGVVEFNRNRGRIALGENAAQLEEYLGAAADPRRPWHRYYLAIAGAGAVLFAAELTGAVPVRGVSAAVVVVGVLACSGAQFYLDRDDDE